MSVLSEMIKNLLSRPFTSLYPKEKIRVPQGYRGRVAIDDDRCIGCSKCSLVCPAQCITMVDSPREVVFRDKTMARKKKPRVKLFMCIRCGLCERHCPTGAIRVTDELAVFGTDRDAVTA